MQGEKTARYTAVKNLLCQTKDLRSNLWNTVPNSSVGDLFTEAPWTKWFPLRVNLVGGHKAGVANNRAELVTLCTELGIGKHSLIPYDVAKKTEALHKNKTRRDPARPWGWVNSEARRKSGYGERFEYAPK